MGENRATEIMDFAEAGSFAWSAYAAFYQEFIDGITYQLNQSEPNDVPLGGMAACTNEVVARAFIAFYQSTLDAFDQYGIPKDAPPPSEGEDKEQCAACWCNSCAKLEDCTAFPAADGITPPPCAACWDNNPLVPVCGHPECGEYTPSVEALESGVALDPEDGSKIRVACLACWCRDCGNFEDCTVEKEGYEPESKPCPCDGCGGAQQQRFMPRETPPTCGKYIARAAE